MKLNPNIPLYGDPTFRGECPTETAEQATFFNYVRRTKYGAIGLHIKNEGKRTHAQNAKLKAEGGFVKGASDIIIPGKPTFVCELKRKDHTQSTWQTGQQEYLLAAKDAGAFICLCLGFEAAIEAFEEWRKLCEKK